VAGNATPHRVQPWLDDGDITLYHGDSLAILRTLPAGIAQTCVTSPPYWGLRDYGTGQWTGGDEACDHVATETQRTPWANSRPGPAGQNGKNAYSRNETKETGGNCGRCGAQRVDSQLGLESTPTEYVENMVALFREVRRVLRDDGTLWLNLGDSYASTPPGNTTKGVSAASTLNGIDSDRYRDTLDQGHATKRNTVVAGLKPKDLVGIPWRIAFALQADGWYLRSDIIWNKPNPMPESVTDRPTKSHEYVFLFSKQPRYFYDTDAIREPSLDPADDLRRINGDRSKRYSQEAQEQRRAGAFTGGEKTEIAAGRNRRSVWTIPTEPFPEAHFATYPQLLVQPCIQAGTSERGECVECGTPWRRIVETTYEPHPNARSGGDYAGDRSSGDLEHGRFRPQEMKHGRATRVDTTTGWEPSCSCCTVGCIPDPCTCVARPQLVLDPFIGSGTTALVARKHGRRCIGIDLSEEYLAIAAKRTQQLSLLGGLA